MNYLPTYITVDDYFNWDGIDLQVELNNDNTDNPSNAANIFLYRTEKWFLMYIKKYLGIYPDCTNWDTEVIKEALLYQVEWVRMHGDVSLLGSKGENGKFIPTVSPNALMTIRNANMGTQVVTPVWG